MPTQSHELLPLVVQNESTFVSAKLLHKKLHVGRDFSNWIKDRIKDFQFSENSDFLVHSNLANQKGRGGDRRSIDYLLTLDMAKELAMLERNEVGRAIRRYFIAKEKELRSITHLPKEAALFKGLKAQNINGRRLFPYKEILSRCGYSTKSGTNARKHRYPGHFILQGRLLLITEEFALHLHHQKQVFNNRLALKQMQPVLPFNFGDTSVFKTKGGGL